MSDIVGGDKITAGNISGSYAAIGAGAQVIVTQIQQALSVVEERDKSIQAAKRRLGEAIQKKLATITKPTADFIAERGNPYKALLDYKLEDAPFFYGRAEAITAMREKLGQSKLTILHSDSGSGKSSLLQAGLAARLLADGHFPLYLRPYNQRPDQVIKKFFLPDYATQPELAHFSDEAMDLKGFLDGLTFYLGDRRLVIFLDQFEEFFTELPPGEQEEFAIRLHECVESDLPVWWVVAVRKDYFSDLRLFAALKPYENEYFLPSFKLEEAQEVIVEPAALKNIAYEEGLVNQILDDIRYGAADIPPAQVQLVCYTLFDELAGDRAGELITFDLYNKPRGRAPGAPGAEGILTSHLSRVLDRELKAKERKVAHRVLEELVTSGVRRVKRGQDDLLEVLGPEQATLLEPVLKTLYDNRLVRRELDENDEPLYELAHDYLLREIELDPEAQARKAAQELLNQEANAYRQHGTLLSEDKFAIINNQRDYLQINELATELLRKSQAEIEAERQKEAEQQRVLAEEQRKRAEEAEARQAAEEEARRQAEARAGDAEAAAEAQRKSSSRLRWLVFGLILLLAAGLLLTGFANRLSQVSRARGMIYDSQMQARDGNFELATLLALEAKQHESGRAENLLGDVIPIGWVQSRGVNVILEEYGWIVNSVAWHPNWRTLASGYQDGIVKLWNVDQDALEKTLGEHQMSVKSVAWSPAGSLLASSSTDGVIKIWDVERGELVSLPDEHEESVNSMAWSPDGRLLASGSADGVIKLWDVAHGKVERILRGDGYSVNSVAWSPDGRVLAFGSDDGVIRLWDVKERELMQPLKGHTNDVNVVTWNPLWPLLASGSQDKTVKLWDVARGEVVQTLEGHKFSVDSLAWHPAGYYLASGSRDNTIRLWDVEQGGLVHTLTGYQLGVNSLDWSYDTLASGSFRDTIKLWPGWVLQDPCKWLNTNLTPEEWVQYIGYSIYRPTCPSKSSHPAPTVYDAFTDFPDNLKYLLITWSGRVVVGVAGLLALILVGFLLWANYRLLHTRSGRIGALVAAAVTLLWISLLISEAVFPEEWYYIPLPIIFGLGLSVVLWIGYRIIWWLWCKFTQRAEMSLPAE